MREFQLQDGRTCVLHGTGMHGNARPAAAADAPLPEIVQYMLRGAGGTCLLPADWATHQPDDLRALVERAAQPVLTGAVVPFDGPNGPAIRDFVIGAALMPIERLQALVRICAGHRAEQHLVDGLVAASGERMDAARRLPAYLLATAAVILAGAVAPSGASEVAVAICPAATALLVCAPPSRRDHSAHAGAYRALIAPFYE